MNETSEADAVRRPSVDSADPVDYLEESDCAFSDDNLDMDMDMDMDMDFDLAMPPVQEDVQENGRRIFAPPPRIAARFYRPSQARRRDSAASSRRNSISSAHSRCSSIQPSGRRDGDQSKYAAQHVRRANFLEDRRARLADRAAHAEKVRLRAALAKAAPRGQATSEERALAAQQARQRNLAEIVASCAEEVNKAKQIAESTKERREQEIAKMKAQMEERMAEAQRRREELRNKTAVKRARGQSVVARKSAEALVPHADAAAAAGDLDDAPPMGDDEAATKIQTWWRGCARRKIVLEFHALGLGVDGIRDTSFDTVVELLAREKVLLVTAPLLRICGLQEGEPGSVEEMAAVRTFLSAFLILGHPDQVLNSIDEGAEDGDDDGQLGGHRLPATELNNPQLQDLVDKAKDVLISFENILAWLTPANRYTMPPSLHTTFPQAYSVFYNAFIAWKSRDSNALIEVMLMQMVELDAIFHTVKETSDDAAAALYRKSIQDSQLMLIVRIKKLAGAERGKKMIFQAVSEARKARKAKKQAGDTRPRVADSESVSGDAQATASSFVSSPDSSQMLTPPSTPAGKGGRAAAAAAAGARPAATVKTGLNGLIPDNRVVVHELAINKEYQIPAEEYVEQQAAFSQPLYLQMRAAMGDASAEANFRVFMLRAGHIKDKLQRPLKEGNSMYNLIGEVLDVDIAQRQFEMGSFSYEKFFSAMASLLPKLCAPFRDDQVRDLVQNKLCDGCVIDRIEALDRFVDVMLCDYINYLLKIAAPQLIESAVPYEAKRFGEELGDEQDNLPVAEAAWRSAAAKVAAEVQRRDVEGANHPKSRPTASKIYAQMLVDVFTQPTPVGPEQIPEMLRLDQARINQVSTTVQRIITVGAVLLQCKNLLKRDVRSAWKAEAARVMAVLEANHASVETAVDGAMAALEAGRSMPAPTKTHLRALVTKVLTASRDMALRSTEPRDPVLRLLLTRLRGNILARLASGSASEKVKAANTAGEKLASLGLSEFVEKVRQMSDLLDKVGAVDRAAHSSWWDAVAAKVQREDLDA
ncbi:iq calmodulin-binding motif domain [Trichoderma cornu-damae]|uniref:Iq calmodulin-binding motif domain n=1 Tax=Trichoderma cornu-damae TaxID=654480 RepID=A0A9P8QTC5_9HYPO|nr:iq calmodulin-binding motif domain [Trichoderma cornu-damae]